MQRWFPVLLLAAALSAGSAPSSAQAASRSAPATAHSSGKTSGPNPGEHRLSAQEIRELARRELLWCDDYKSASDDCQAVTLVQLAPDGRLAETTTMLISDGPRLQAFIGEIDSLDGDKVCSKVTAASMPFAFTLEGKKVSEDATLGLRTLLAASLSELDGKTVCQAFYRIGDSSRVREEVTVDGARRTDLETTYILHEPGVGFGLRAQVGRDDAKGQKA
jgi:hypothetical protein